MDRGRSFDAAAAAYDAQRSGYPSALFSDLVAFAGLEAGDRVLEIGCGSGQATADFLAAGLDVTGVEPGPSLVALARAKFANSDMARFEATTFEAWEPAGRRFQLVAAAQSWHWLRPETAFAKAADALSAGGALAIFGHTPMWSADLVGYLKDAYLQEAPDLWSPPPEAWYLPEGPVLDLMEASGKFSRFQHRAYAWRRSYASASFVAYLGTRSDHLVLPERRRAELLSKIEKALPAVVEADWATNLYAAVRA